MQKVLFLNILSLAFASVVFAGVTMTGDGKYVQVTTTYDDQGKTKTDTPVCLIIEGTKITNGGTGKDCLDKLKKPDNKLPKTEFKDGLIEEKHVVAPKSGIGNYPAEKIYASVKDGKLVLVEQSAKVGGNPPRVITDTIISTQPLQLVDNKLPDPNVISADTVKKESNFRREKTLPPTRQETRDEFNGITPSPLDPGYDPKVMDSLTAGTKAPEVIGVCTAKEGTYEFCDELNNQKCHLQGKHELAGVCGQECATAAKCVKAYERLGQIEKLHKEIDGAKEDIDSKILSKLAARVAKIEAYSKTDKCTPTPEQRTKNQSKIARVKRLMDSSCNKAWQSTDATAAAPQPNAAKPPVLPDPPGNMSGQSNPPPDNINQTGPVEVLQDMAQPASTKRKP